MEEGRRKMKIGAGKRRTEETETKGLDKDKKKRMGRMKIKWSGKG